MVARATLNEPFRCTSITLSQSDSSILWNMPSRRMPAGLITACRPPKVSSACSSMPFTEAMLVTLSELATSPPPPAPPAPGSARPRRAFVAAALAAAEVVDHHLGALACRDQGALLADPVAAPGDQHHLPVQSAHDRFLFSWRERLESP